MAIKGLSIPVFGKYNYNKDSGEVLYSDGIINPHAISYTLTINSTDGNPLYGDNRIIENDLPRFQDGELSLETDDLTMDTSKYLLGVKQITRTYGGDTVETLIYDEDQKSVVLGVGLIELHQNDDVDNYKAVILKRVVFSLPEDAATTKGESVEWQTKTITGNVSRSEEKTADAKYPWKEDAWFEKEEEAEKYLKAMLGVA